jgi:hypothetical protein
VSAPLLVLVGLLLLAACWGVIIPRWRLGLELFILFIPFAGAVELRLYQFSWAVLIKDFLFAMPAYIGFALSGEVGSALAGIPRSFGAIVLLFVGIVLVQAFNPSGPGLLATLVGLKVWLFYLPMLLLGRAYVRDEASLLRLSRLMIGLVWLPCSVGILQWLLSLALGYQYVIGLFYGAAAAAATQGFSRFNNGLMRIPATFAFPTQYFVYVLCMFVPALGSVATEQRPLWSRARAASVPLLCIAGFMTGERAAFVMIPLLLGSFYLLRRGALGVVWAAFALVVFLLVTLSISGVDPTGLLHMEADLTQGYATGQLDEFKQALEQTWIGRGVGSSTGAARLVNDDPSQLVGFEGLYAQAISELGIAGCLILIAVQVGLLLVAESVRSSLQGTKEEPYCNAIFALVFVVMIYNYKGPVLSLDPANMLYWLFGGVLLSLPDISVWQVSGDWYPRYLAQPVLRVPDELDTASPRLSPQL